MARQAASYPSLERNLQKPCLTEAAMNTASHCQRFGRAAIALAALSIGTAFAAGTAPESTATSAGPVVVAQAAVVAPAPMAPAPMVVVRSYPAYEAGAVAAAKQGPEALRRYLWRTRMIYNFYYPDFIPLLAAT